MIRPATGIITLRYGATTSPYSASNPHKGLDIANKAGTFIHAPEDGIVTIAGDLGDCGLAVEIKGKYTHRLCHNQRLVVKVGALVLEGQKVAEMGSTGQATGSHVHWVVWAGARRINPEKLKVEEPDMYKEKYDKLLKENAKLKADIVKLKKAYEEKLRHWRGRRAGDIEKDGRIKAALKVLMGKK